MNNWKTLLICTLAAGALMGCSGLQDRTYVITQRTGDLQPQDVEHAEAYRKILPQELWLAPQQIRVQPGPGFTHVFVSGVNDDALRAGVLSDAAILNAHNPFNPIHLGF
ncbi:MAG TPA: hypothetical protein VNZ22_09215, partial [Bacillota bacterium]|nr:hypothetical protein [Bacillota bacterium]